jgi:hypothetical protein
MDRTTDARPGLYAGWRRNLRGRPHRGGVPQCLAYALMALVVPTTVPSPRLSESGSCRDSYAPQGNAWYFASLRQNPV